ncbi:MAG: methionine--tRNA ligase [Deltaproteobacteria bacterium]|nr:methionine--tRNA ligase [Deltaproteobacteria bacterium]
MTRRILVTSALPYANGSIHIGHLVEYLQTDIWVRYLKLRGYDARYFCADDTHGTPVMIRAMKEGIEPEALIERMHAEHVRDFADFGIEFDNYYSTHSPENERWAGLFYERLKQGGHLDRRSVEQTYCEHDRIFLPDRLVRGICPRCGAADQYGDSCEQCNATYEPTELVDPRCSICGQTPVRKTTEHIFVKLAHFEDMLREWTRGHLQPEVANYVGRWIEEGLRDWDISRDGPYFGFPIPGEENKYFYVWLDAPIGYIASSDNWCQQHGCSADELWKDGQTEIVHIIGKDIVYFHTLFWPAMLHAAGLSLPTAVHVHGFLRVEGEKMSKSRGTFISARTYLAHLDPQCLRYYYAAKLSDRPEDIDLVFEDFINRVNAELVNKLANLYSRNLKFVHKQLGGRLEGLDEQGRALVAEARAAAGEIAAAYERRDLAAVVLRISQLAERGNLFMQTAEPWKVAREDEQRARAICAAAAGFGLILAIYLKPILPGMVARIERMMKVEPLSWQDIEREWEAAEIGEFERLAERLDRGQVDALVEASREEFEQQAGAAVETETEPAVPLAPECTIEDFARVDMRVAEVLEVSEVEGASKLLRLKLSLGPLGERQVFAGIREAYPEPQKLLGRKVVCVANLKPRKMRFGLSEGMVCASSAPESAKGGPRIRVLAADADARPGDRIS